MNIKRFEKDEIERLRQIDDLAERSFGVRPFARYPDEMTCPCCRRMYRPKYRSKEEAPEGSIYREQHLSGICSDACWDAMTLPEGRR